jgi:hypothetical protein
MKNYTGTISLANENLQELVKSVGSDLFEECLRIGSIRAYWIIGKELTDTDMPDYIDTYCRKPGCVVRNYSQICIVSIQLFPPDGSMQYFWVEADSDHIFSLVSRINKLKVFL